MSIKLKKPDRDGAVISHDSRGLLRIFLEQRESGLFILLIVMVILMSLARPGTFFTSENLFNILRQVSLVTIIAVGQTLVITSAGIDLSVGFSLGLASIILSYCLEAGVNTGVAIALGIGISVVLGLFNGLVVTKIGLPPFIVTIGTSYIARGISFVITTGFPIKVTDPFILGLGMGGIGKIPFMTIIMVVIVAIGIYILNNTSFGMRTKAIGGNEMATRLSGVNVDRQKITIFMLCGLFCGIAGVMMAGRLSAGNPNAGVNYDVDSIAATIVGGTSMAGGEGTIIGTLLGSLLLGVIKNGLVLLNVNMYWQTIVSGAIIITVCTVDKLTRGRKA
ncbi:MAG: ABC transporter permease [Clostridiales bacterium]|nr:ABC transporter permease [Clostridiales bacterium]